MTPELKLLHEFVLFLATRVEALWDDYDVEEAHRVYQETIGYVTKQIELGLDNPLTP